MKYRTGEDAERQSISKRDGRFTNTRIGEPKITRKPKSVTSTYVAAVCLFGVFFRCCSHFCDALPLRTIDRGGLDTENSIDGAAEERIYLKVVCRPRYDSLNYPSAVTDRSNAQSDDLVIRLCCAAHRAPCHLRGCPRPWKHFLFPLPFGVNVSIRSRGASHSAMIASAVVTTAARHHHSAPRREHWYRPAWRSAASATATGPSVDVR